MITLESMYIREVPLFTHNRDFPGHKARVTVIGNRTSTKVVSQSQTLTEPDSCTKTGESGSVRLAPR